jgi:hypothetical protein
MNNADMADPDEYDPTMDPDLKSDDWFRARARDLYERDGYVEVDLDATISRGDDPGAYVQGWVWVPMDEKEDCMIHWVETD